MVGLTAGGESYVFGRNNVQLTADQIACAGKLVQPVDYRGT